jgi:hypothetical protein
MGAQDARADGAVLCGVHVGEVCGGLLLLTVVDGGFSEPLIRR